MRCNQTYLTTSLTAECMSCHAPWDREFIDDHFPAAWTAGPFSRFRETVLLDSQKAQLPATQYMVQNFKTAQDLARQAADVPALILELKTRIRQLEGTRWNHGHRINRIRESNYQSDGVGNDGDRGGYRSFVRACPVGGCRGFLSTALKCGVCATYACADCFGVVGAERDAEHACNPDDVETAKLIRKDSRPCPKCGIYISKIDGCDQMFCVQCRTAFSWRTGVVVRGTIHNPHYFEMLRNESTTGEIPRQPGDAPADAPAGACGGDPTDPGAWTTSLHRELRAYGVVQGDFYNDMMRMQRHACHLHRSTIPDLRRHPTDFADLRMHFLLDSFDEPTFKRKLLLRERAIEKHATLVACYSAKVQAITDVVGAFVQRTLPIERLAENLSSVHDVFEGYLTRIGKRFKCHVDFGPKPRPFLIEIENDTATSTTASPRV
jgi:hypothetical protein